MREKETQREQNLMEKTCRNDIAWFSFLWPVRLSNFLFCPFYVHLYQSTNYLSTASKKRKKDNEHESKQRSLYTLKTMINYDIEGEY